MVAAAVGFVRRRQMKLVDAEKASMVAGRSSAEVSKRDGDQVPF